jgi:hypothetical protein
MIPWITTLFTSKSFWKYAGIAAVILMTTTTLITAYQKGYKSAENKYTAEITQLKLEYEKALLEAKNEAEKEIQNIEKLYLGIINDIRHKPDSGDGVGRLLTDALNRLRDQRTGEDHSQ